MTAQSALDLRTRKLTDRYIISRGRDYVLCWLMQALRADENPAIDAAVALGNDRGLPVVVLHTLDNTYPYASHRLHRFILEASQELEGGVEARGLRFVRYVRRAAGAQTAGAQTAGAQTAGAASVDVAARLAERAAAVVVDDVPTFVTREYADRLAERLDRAVLAVDACCAVPMNAFEAPLTTTKAFRAAHTPLRDEHLDTDLRQEPAAPPFDGDLDVEHEPLDSDLDAIIAACGVDMTVPPAPGWAGRRSAALDRLRHAVEHVVPRYKWTRNNPALDDATAAISPWMHFGVLSPREVARAVLDAEAAGDVHPAARWKFLDETLTWREVYHHRCRWEPDWAGWSGLPADARETLEAHASDPRPALYSLDELARGETDDETWNAAQKQFLLDGWMNNNLRMYWVKQILKWRETPQDTFATACWLNDRFSLDGRDASTYGGIRWGFGDAKLWSSERPVYGHVASKSDRALRKRDGVPAWLVEQAAREAFHPAPPADEAAALARYR
ncbi:deoxyribodipyrimidine photo-lyase [Rubrivirga sp. S365]|uniref:deoxyribodipyrimidine photo-lyase n=1 Tax=Rubrivirga sp. S365 TaxID=3076080 RepID=UPI0028CAF107|nr:deoxyribodipyrimidine photo-lyase [Rubrivirga sp. S365]MDT7855390.1 deoxyribodipyrimidine photo-lyase [Rubrivirga sp. S365]